VENPAFRDNLIKKLYLYDLLGQSLENQDAQLEAIVLQFSAIDALITTALVDYNLNRLSFLDRAIIRLATYSLINKEYQDNFIFTEMLELTKKYTDLGDSKQKNFNHRLLSNIKSRLGR
jgi:N utilization substance protein B